MRKFLEKNHCPVINLFIGLLFGLLLFPSGIKSIIIIIIIIALLIISLNFKRKFTFRKQFFFLNAGVYLFIIGTLFYTENIDYAFSKLQTMSSLIVFPLLFSFLNNDELKKIVKHTNTYLWVYIFSVFLFNVVPFIWFYLTNYSFSGIIRHFSYIIIVDIGKYSIHPIYMSMHCCIAIIFSLQLFQKSQNNSKKIILIIINIIFVLFLIIYARKGPIISIMLTFAVLSFFKKRVDVKLSIGILVGVALLLIAIPKTRDRFLELTHIENVSENSSSSTNIRYSIYKNASELILLSPFFGYGIGDYNNVLSEKYILENQKILIGKNYNTHNQYLSFMLIGGGFLLLFFLITQTIIVKECINNKNELPLILLLFFGVLMFTENILEREYGVIFFALFLNFFTLKNVIKIEE